MVYFMAVLEAERRVGVVRLAVGVMGLIVVRVAPPMIVLRIVVMMGMIVVVVRVAVRGLSNHGSHVSPNDATPDNVSGPSQKEREGASDDGILSFELQQERVASVEVDSLVSKSWAWQRDSASRRVLVWVRVAIPIGLGERI